MVYFKNNQWHICKEKVKYIQHGEETTQYVGSEGHDWWVDFADKWEHTEIVEFIPVEPTQEQVDRLKEINELNIPEDFGALVENYVKEGLFPEGYNHPLAKLKLEKENGQLREYQTIQDSVIEEILFNIIPTIGGMGGE